MDILYITFMIRKLISKLAGQEQHKIVFMNIMVEIYFL